MMVNDANGDTDTDNDVEYNTEMMMAVVRQRPQWDERK